MFRFAFLVGICALCASTLVPSSLVASFDRPLTRGAVGDDVTELQRFLQAEGFYQFPETTGYFGPITVQAVVAFQRAHGLEAVGEVGPKTRAILNERVAGIGATPSPDALDRMVAQLQLRLLVTQLQILLRDAGYDVNTGITGTLDTATHSAIQAYLDRDTSRQPTRHAGGGGGDDEPSDSTAPIISSISSGTPSDTAATITWVTDEAADTQLAYGTTVAYGATTTLDASAVTSHTVSLTGLSADTTYHFRVRSADASGNIAYSSDQSFTTDSAPDVTAPTISDIASSTGVTTATITWTTDELATSTVQYGATSSYGSASTSATLVTSHSIGLTGLSAGTTYHFQVGSQDAAGNVATSSDLTFTTDTDTYEGLVATRARTISNSAGNTRLMSRYSLVATDDISAARVVFQNFRITGSQSAEQGNGADTTVTASIEYPAGTFTQLQFSGTATGTIPAGDVLFSDSVAVSIPAGDTFWVREFNINSAGTIFNTVRNAALGDLMNAGSNLTDQTMGGTITNLGTYSHPPLAVLAQTDEPSVCIVGDSIGWGKNDTDTAADGRVGIVAKSFPTDLAFVNLSSPGSRANSYLSLSETAARQQLFPFCTHVVSELGNNDLHVSGNSTTTLVANLQSIWAEFPAGTKITQTTITPKTGSSDSWATTENQTDSNSSHRVPFNDLVRSSLISGVNNGYFDIASAVETALNSGIWRVDGTAFKYTTDGLHPSAAGYDLVVTDGAIDTSLFTYP